MWWCLSSCNSELCSFEYLNCIRKRSSAQYSSNIRHACTFPFDRFFPQLTSPDRTTCGYDDHKHDRRSAFILLQIYAQPRTFKVLSWRDGLLVDIEIVGVWQVTKIELYSFGLIRQPVQRLLINFSSFLRIIRSKVETIFIKFLMIEAFLPLRLGPTSAADTNLDARSLFQYQRHTGSLSFEQMSLDKVFANFGHYTLNKLRLQVPCASPTVHVQAFYRSTCLSFTSEQTTSSSDATLFKWIWSTHNFFALSVNAVPTTILARSSQQVLAHTNYIWQH